MQFFDFRYDGFTTATSANGYHLHGFNQLGTSNYSDYAYQATAAESHPGNPPAALHEDDRFQEAEKENELEEMEESNMDFEECDDPKLDSEDIGDEENSGEFTDDLDHLSTVNCNLCGKTLFTGETSRHFKEKHPDATDELIFGDKQPNQKYPTTLNKTRLHR